MRHKFYCGIWTALSMLVLFLIGAGESRGQTADTNLTMALSSNRFLFIVDTSSSMKNHRSEEQKVMSQILMSSANGQLRPGDTLGQWTFNKNVYADFPLKTWGTAPVEEIVWTFTNFINRQHFEGPSHLEKALVEMHHVMKMSDVITVVILHNGKGQIKGTPFDEEINAECAKSFKKSGDKGLPVAVVLQTRGGDIISYRMAFYPWQVVVPEVPPPVFEAPKIVAQIAPPRPVTILPNLILQGEKHAEAPVVPVPVVSETPSNVGQEVAEEPAVTATKQSATTNPPEQTSKDAQAISAKSEPGVSNSPANPATGAPVISTTTTALEPETEAAQPAIATVKVTPTAPMTGPGAGGYRFLTVVLLSGVAFLAGIFLTLRIARARQDARPSLITRSMNVWDK